jgi:cell filamentation protein
VKDYRRWADYFWPDSPDVLRNKLGIRDQRMLNFVESQLSAVRIAEHILENHTGTFDFAHYCDTHRRILGDVYEWGRPTAHRTRGAADQTRS